MKSEKAKYIIDHYAEYGRSVDGLTEQEAEEAAGIAEAEMRERAIEAFLYACSCGIKPIGKIYDKCLYEKCVRYKVFIRQLDKQE